MKKVKKENEKHDLKEDLGGRKPSPFAAIYSGNLLQMVPAKQAEQEEAMIKEAAMLASAGAALKAVSWLVKAGKAYRHKKKIDMLNQVKPRTPPGQPRAPEGPLSRPDPAGRGARIQDRATIRTDPKGYADPAKYKADPSMPTQPSIAGARPAPIGPPTTTVNPLGKTHVSQHGPNVRNPATIPTAPAPPRSTTLQTGPPSMSGVIAGVPYTISSAEGPIETPESTGALGEVIFDWGGVAGAKRERLQSVALKPRPEPSDGISWIQRAALWIVAKALTEADPSANQEGTGVEGSKGSIRW